MSIRMLLVSAGLLAIVCGGAPAQPPIPAPGGAPRLAFPSPPAPSPPPPTVPVPQEKSVDDLLTEMENLRAQKAELEKKEQELTAVVRKKLDAQAERLKKLGVAPKDVKAGEPDRVGKIFLEGNAEKDEKKILGALGLQPGQILQYPKLEAARAALEKAGFRGATVEVLSNELDSPFKDLRVRLGGPDR